MTLSLSSLQTRRFSRADEGAALVMVAVMVAILALFAGLGVDTAYVRYQHQQMQKAADAGAIAAAAALAGGSNWSAAGKNDSAANGFTDTINSTTVQVLNPPQTGNPLIDVATNVEVIVSQAQPTFFMRIGGISTVPVSARAVGITQESNPACIFALDPNARGTFTISGTANVQSNCGIVDDSNNPNAFVDNGGGCAQAPFISVVGGGSGCPGYPLTTGAGYVNDPLQNMVEPTVSKPVSCDYTNEHITGGTATLYAGTYCGGITIDGTNPNVTFAANASGSTLFILYGGGLTINAQATITGNGVTFYNTGTKNGPTGIAPITINGGSGITLSAPTDASNPYAGILFMEDRVIAKNGNFTDTITGGSGSTFNGTLYFPDSNLTYGGNSTTNGYTIIIADTLAINGNSFVGDNYSSLPGGISPDHSSGLLE